MKMKSIFTVTLFLIQAAYAAHVTYKRVCYYTNWSQYRHDVGKFLPEDIDPTLCTHIIFAFAKLQGNRLIAREWNDETVPWRKGLYERVNDLKKRNPDLKTLLSVGGWVAGGAPFSNMASTAIGRKEFSNSTVQFLRKRNFDGLDLDWEYPGSRGGSSQDKENLVLLLQELDSAFKGEIRTPGEEKLMLSMAVPTSKEKIDEGYKVPEVSLYCDLLNVMTYNYHGVWESKTGHHSALYRRSTDTEYESHLNVAWSIRYWIQQGAAARKLVVGFPLFGRGFTLSDRNKKSLDDPTSGGSVSGTFTKEAGFLSYFEICRMLKSGAEVTWDGETKVPYLVLGDQWVGYDNERSVKEKVKWLKKYTLGGLMVWALPLDDFKGTECGKNMTYPLLRGMIEELDKPDTPLKRNDNATAPTSAHNILSTPVVSTKSEPLIETVKEKENHTAVSTLGQIEPILKQAVNAETIGHQTQSDQIDSQTITIDNQGKIQSSAYKAQSESNSKRDLSKPKSGGSQSHPTITDSEGKLQSNSKQSGDDLGNQKIKKEPLLQTERIQNESLIHLTEIVNKIGKESTTKQNLRLVTSATSERSYVTNTDNTPTDSNSSSGRGRSDSIIETTTDHHIFVKGSGVLSDSEEGKLKVTSGPKRLQSTSKEIKAKTLERPPSSKSSISEKRKVVLKTILSEENKSVTRKIKTEIVEKTPPEESKKNPNSRSSGLEIKLSSGETRNMSIQQKSKSGKFTSNRDPDKKDELINTEKRQRLTDQNTDILPSNKSLTSLKDKEKTVVTNKFEKGKTNLNDNKLSSSTVLNIQIEQEQVTVGTISNGQFSPSVTSGFVDETTNNTTEIGTFRSRKLLQFSDSDSGGIGGGFGNMLNSLFGVLSGFTRGISNNGQGSQDRRSGSPVTEGPSVVDARPSENRRQRPRQVRNGRRERNRVSGASDRPMSVNGRDRSANELDGFSRDRSLNAVGRASNGRDNGIAPRDRFNRLSTDEINSVSPFPNELPLDVVENMRQDRRISVGRGSRNDINRNIRERLRTRQRNGRQSSLEARLLSDQISDARRRDALRQNAIGISARDQLLANEADLLVLEQIRRNEPLGVQRDNLQAQLRDPALIRSREPGLLETLRRRISDTERSRTNLRRNLPIGVSNTVRNRILEPQRGISRSINGIENLPGSNRQRTAIGIQDTVSDRQRTTIGVEGQGVDRQRTVVAVQGSGNSRQRPVVGIQDSVNELSRASVGVPNIGFDRQRTMTNERQRSVVGIQDAGADSLRTVVGVQDAGIDRQRAITGVQGSGNGRQRTVISAQNSGTDRPRTAVSVQDATVGRQRPSVGIEGSANGRPRVAVGVQDSITDRQNTVVGVRNGGIERQNTPVGVQSSVNGRARTPVGVQISGRDRQRTAVGVRGTENNRRQRTSVGIQDSAIERQRTAVGVQGSGNNRSRPTIGIQSSRIGISRATVGVQEAGIDPQQTPVIGVQDIGNVRQRPSVGIQNSRTTRQRAAVGVQGSRGPRQRSSIGVQGRRNSRPRSAASVTSSGTRQRTVVGVQNSRTVRQRTPVGVQRSSNNRQRTAIGVDGPGSGRQSTAVGIQNIANSRSRTAIGVENSGNARQRTSVGVQGVGNGRQRTAVAIQSSPNSLQRAAIGVESSGNSRQRTSVGVQSSASTRQRTSIGVGGSGTSRQRTAVGVQGATNSRQRTAIGVDSSGNIRQRTAVGVQSSTNARQRTAVGVEGSDNTRQRTAVGVQGIGSPRQQTVVGVGSSGNTRQRTAVGVQGSTNTRQSTAVGVEGSGSVGQRNAVSIQGSSSSRPQTAIGVESTGMIRQRTAVGVRGSPNTRQRTPIGVENAGSTIQRTSVGVRGSANTRQRTIGVEDSGNSKQRTAIGVQSTRTTNQQSAIGVLGSGGRRQRTSVGVQTPRNARQRTAIGVQNTGNSLQRPAVAVKALSGTRETNAVGVQDSGDGGARTVISIQGVPNRRVTNNRNLKTDALPESGRTVAVSATDLPSASSVQIDGTRQVPNLNQLQTQALIEKTIEERLAQMNTQPVIPGNNLFSQVSQDSTNNASILVVPLNSIESTLQNLLPQGPPIQIINETSGLNIADIANTIVQSNSLAPNTIGLLDNLGEQLPPIDLGVATPTEFPSTFVEPMSNNLNVEAILAAVAEQARAEPGVSNVPTSLLLEIQPQIPPTEPPLRNNQDITNALVQLLRENILNNNAPPEVTPAPFKQGAIQTPNEVIVSTGGQPGDFPPNPPPPRRQEIDLATNQTVIANNQKTPGTGQADVLWKWEV